LLLGLRVIRLEPQRFLTLAGSLVEITLAGQRDAEVQVDFGALRVESERFLVVFNGVLGSAQIAQGAGEITVHAGVIWLEAQGFLVLPYCVGQPALNAKTALVDTDHDGMPDDWELKHRLDPKNPADWAQASEQRC
jgi:hypothetical protein